MTKQKVNKTKQTLINQNIAQSKFGMYARCATGPCIKNNFNQNFNIGDIQTICDVEVYNMHAIDVIKQYCQLGPNPGFKDGWMNPVTMCSIGDDFIGSNYPQSEGIRDDTFNIRTNYNCITRNNNPFPVKQNECIYNRFVTVIRDNNLIPVTDLNQLYRFAIISVAPINKPQLLDENTMNSSDFIKLMCTIETIFQTAISGSHNILVLTPFGNTEDNVPQEDVAKIYNSCIFKYGHRFSKIIVAVPIWHGSYLFDLFNDTVVRPQNFESEDEETEEEHTIKNKNNKKQNKTSNNREL